MELGSNVIPDMTDNLGRYWHQPDRGNILIDDHYALMSNADFDWLKNYECSNPSGVYPGKMWRNGDWLCWYGNAVNGVCYIYTRKIIIV